MVTTNEIASIFIIIIKKNCIQFFHWHFSSQETSLLLLQKEVLLKKNIIEKDRWSEGKTWILLNTMITQLISKMSLIWWSFETLIIGVCIGCWCAYDRIVWEEQSEKNWERREKKSTADPK